jgi:hypothetical protein
MANLKKNLLGRYRPRWKDNTKMDLQEIGWEELKTIDLAQNREKWQVLANTVMKLRVRYVAGNFLTN